MRSLRYRKLSPWVSSLAHDVLLWGPVLLGVVLMLMRGPGYPL